MKKNVLLISIFFCVLTTYLKAQVKDIDQTFRPVFSAGLLTSQVNGSAYSGFSKVGYFLGIGINRQLSKVVEVEFALTLLQKGARHNYGLDSASRNNPNNPFYLSRLTYLEIPLVFKFNYKKIKAEVGAAAGYLIDNPPNVQTNNPTVLDYGYKNMDFSYVIGLGFKLKPYLLLNIRFEYSMLPVRPYYTSTVGIYHGQFPYSLFNRGLYNNLLQLTLNYKLPSKIITITPPPANAQ
ncbi:MAG TPA: outer membrane beta-barrel protein [Bacteroidia bacterium]